MSWTIAIFIGFGGAVGAVIRYWLGSYIMADANKYFPFGTLLVNIIGCLAIGYCFAYFQTEECKLSESFKLAISAGLLGGLTTFSTFSLDTLVLIQNEQVFKAAINVVASVVVGLLAVLVGMHIFSTK